MQVDGGTVWREQRKIATPGLLLAGCDNEVAAAAAAVAVAVGGRSG